jgi:ABC-type polysaccharide/polyol phosphate transport system ATPase subunit
MRLIQEIVRVDDTVFHKPIGDWPSSLKDLFKLAVSLAFDFDVITVGRINCWDHRALHPHAVRIRKLFEQRIDGRTLIVSANGQNSFAIDYCDEGLAIVNGDLAYRGDPEVCLELVKEESRRQKQERRQRVNSRIAQLLEQEEAEDDSGSNASPELALGAKDSAR